ncbi:MAG: helix-turn-helix domain-containing protein [Acidipila sp.]|nr:helix-turn-helix domain-containing protein [Acidipila sp.]
MQKTNFGEHLRREREMRGVSLEEISTATRIAVRFLEAMENEQWDRLPGGVFNRGFIRSVARFLGLDEDGLVGEYALLTHDQPEKAVWATSTRAERSAGAREPAPRIWKWALLALLVILMAGGAWILRGSSATLRSWRHPVPAPARAQSPPPSAAAVSHDAALKTEPTAAPNTLAGTAPGNVAAPVTTSSTGPAASPAARPADGSTSNATRNDTERTTRSSNANPAMLELKVEATQSTELTVVSDGKTVFAGPMTPGSAEQFKARERFEVAASNSTAILMDLNGQTLAPPGLPGAPGKITLTRKDLKKP